MRALRALSLVVLSLAAAPAMADQSDPRLDTLFAQLKQVQTPPEAQAIELQIWSAWLETDSPTVALLMHRTLQAMNEGRLEDSLRVLDDVVQIAPNFAEGWNKRATVLYLLDRYQESLVDVERTLELEPRHFGALSGRGLIYEALGEEAKALEAYERALEVNPHLPHARNEVKRLKKKVRGEKI